MKIYRITNLLMMTRFRKSLYKSIIFSGLKPVSLLISSYSARNKFNVTDNQDATNRA
jgi:hypothetical protein